MAYSTPSTATVGQILTSARWNSEVRDNLRYLKGMDGPVTIDNALTVSGSVAAASASVSGALTTNTLSVTGTTGPLTVAGNLGMNPTPTLGATINNVVQASRRSYAANGNVMFETDWLRRDASGTGWNNARTHNALSVDSSFATPGVDTRTWYERSPSNGVHYWGDQATTFATLTSTGLGVGTTAPKGRLHAYGSIGGCLHWDYNGFVNIAVTVLPAGSVNKALWVQGVILGSGGTANGVNGYILALSNNWQLYADGGTNSAFIYLNADGSVTVARTAGGQSYKASLWITYI